MGFITNEDIEQRQAAGIKMNRLNCGWNLPAADLSEIILFINQWQPQTDTEKRDKHILQLAFIQDMNASQIVRLNDPLIVGHGNRSRGKPLSASSILAICYKYAPNARQRTTKKTRATDRRNNLFAERQQGKIDRPKICSTCGRTDGIELHHIIPIAAGGTNDYYNLIYLCHNCHRLLHQILYKKIRYKKEKEGSKANF